MKKLYPSQYFMLYLLLTKLCWANFSCPPYKSKSKCEDACQEEKNDCIREMREYLQDKDNLADRYFAKYMINIGCPEKYAKNMAMCDTNCN